MINDFLPLEDRV